MELYTLTTKGSLLSHSPARQSDPKKANMMRMVYFLSKAHVTDKEKIVASGGGDYSAWNELVRHGIIQKAG